MRKGLISMSLKEVDRLKLLERIKAGEMTQSEARKQIGISKRQMIRVCEKFRKHGPASVISMKRGKPSNHRLSDGFRGEVLHEIETKYRDFGPTLAHEKLREIHGFKIGLESVRQIMVAAGLWKAKSRKRVKPHQMRTRRPQRGELIQIDGSPHDWFEGRAPRCCLLLAIDDATGEVMAARFVEVECTEGYFDLMRDYINRHGRPQALYSDKHGIFRINAKDPQSGTGDTQFSRAMKELGVKIICANTPQAKGRVERMNQTMQDRLVKEMRLAGVFGIEAGNAFLIQYLPILNGKYAVTPASPVDAHRRELPTEAQLDLIFSTQTMRKFSKSLELQYNNVTYQAQVKTPSYAMRGASVMVCEREEMITLIYKGKSLEYTTFKKQNKTQEIVSSKDIDFKFDGRCLGVKPKDTHPWKQNYPARPDFVKKEHLSTARERQFDSCRSTAFHGRV